MKTYLGDGVYVEDSGEDLVLTTENGVATTNTIYLDDEVLANLMQFLNAVKERRELQERFRGTT